MSENTREYNEWLDKFKPRHTSDDCFTPSNIYTVIKDMVCKRWSIDPATVCRPFYPGGDYEHFDYANRVVIDNPPFSLTHEIVMFYTARNIPFFIFCSGRTPLPFGARSADVTCVITFSNIVYDNGTKVPTSFLTNLENSDVLIETWPALYDELEKANLAQAKKLGTETRPRTKCIYPKNLFSLASLSQIHDVPITIHRKQAALVQAANEYSIYGNGILVSDDTADMLIRAREQHELMKKQRERQLTLSPEQMQIVDRLNGKDGNK